MIARSLLQRVSPVAPETTMSEVFDLFTANPQCVALPIVDGTRPIGLITRKAIIEGFAQPFRREIYGKRDIRILMDPDPLLVEANTDLDDLSRRIVEAGMQHMHDGFILTEHGAYAGMGTGPDLLRVLSEHKQAHLYQLAHFDALTGLPNRLLFQDRLLKAMQHAQRAGHLIALLFIDLDRFKVINDTLGHSAGDALLKAVAQRLSERLRVSDTLARMGGDEFTIILSDVREPEAAALYAKGLLEAAEKPYQIGEHEVFVSASIGVTLYPLDSQSGANDAIGTEALLQHADAAMYRAKEQGKNNVQFYRSDMNGTMLERLRLETDLRKALHNDEFVLHYQPRIRCVDGVVTGVEALIRWQHPTLGLIPPAKFIPLAEETGLIIPLGDWVLRSACEQAKQWRASGVQSMRMAINLSARQFRHKDLVGTIERALRETGLDPDCLEVELTESLAMHDVKQTVVTLNDLNDLGVSIAIDDFGTGYSSLAYLRRFPVDFLKIDQSFVQEIGVSEDCAIIARTIISMAHNLQLQVVGEGVETEQQFEFLCTHGCEEAQGFLFARPLPAPELTAFIAAGRYRAPSACGTDERIRECG